MTRGLTLLLVIAGCADSSQSGRYLPALAHETRHALTGDPLAGHQ